MRPDLGPSDIPEARMAAAQERSWTADNPQAGWAPPAGASAPVRPVSVEPARFAPLRTRSLLATRWLSFTFLLGLAALVIDVLWLQQQSAPDWTVNDLITVSKLMDATSIAQVVVYLIGAMIFIAWFYRAYGNLPALGVPHPRHGRGWAIGSWFVPIANLFLPKQLANDVWRSGDPGLSPGDPGWQAAPVAALVNWWWALWLLGGMTATLAGNLMSDADTLDAFRAGVIVDAASQVLGLASVLAAIAVVKRSTRRQESRARLLDVPGAVGA
jgi:hypothetical protein